MKKNAWADVVRDISKQFARYNGRHLSLEICIVMWQITASRWRNTIRPATNGVSLSDSTISAICISDAWAGIAHSLCTLECQDNHCLYDWVLDNMTIPCHSRQYEFSHLNLEYAILAKRKLSQLVSEKIVEDWAGSRMPTVSGFASLRLLPLPPFANSAGVSA